ncbi:Inner membrane protein [Salmonella enterica subsp. enterica serovar Typhimurium]|nr:Inner membrane protein [Salmonella enterica subsp. enterica serovar Typhimurium]
MFESKINPLWQSFILAVQEEVKPALGCTEPISLALAAAAAAAELNGTVERIDAWVFAQSDEKWYGRYRSRNGNGRATDRRGVGRVGR